MRNRTSVSIIAVAAAAVGVVVSLSVIRPAGQAVRPERTVDGHPNLSGIWQANNEAHWDLEAHAARAGVVMQQGAYDLVMQQGAYDFPYVQVPAAPSLPFGAAGGVPGSLGVVGGDGRIPYTPEAAAQKQENAERWLDRDPEIDCFLPGIPRATRVYALPVPDHSEHEQDLHDVHLFHGSTPPASSTSTRWRGHRTTSGWGTRSAAGRAIPSWSR